MTPEAQAEALTDSINQPPSTAGMTTRVVKGSLWTLAGQLAPLGVSFFVTPLVIRMLGPEGYGVLILVALIPGYLGFAEMGMSLASTKFASAAYAEGDKAREARIVRTAAMIALFSSVPFAVAMFLLAGQFAAVFNVPEQYLADAALALRLASVTFVINILCAIFNTPALARLRMDLNTLVNSGSRILGLAATPVALYLGFGVVGAVAALLGASIINLAGHLAISRRLLPNIAAFSIDRPAIRPMLRFGGALAVAAIAALLLSNLEKAVLARTASVEDLGYYSVAFMLATLATFFSQAMIQSLIPAFSQLMTPERRDQLDGLFTRALRLNIVMILPMLATMVVLARPFFTYWAGDAYGRQSTYPFYILAGGLAFNLMAYVPYTVLMASGRAELFARLYWMELVPYLGVTALLTVRFGMMGAASAWALRIIADTAMIGLLARRHVGVSFRVFGNRLPLVGAAIIILMVPVIFTIFSSEITIWPFALLAPALAAYAALAWKKFISDEESKWLYRKIDSFFARSDQ